MSKAQIMDESMAFFLAGHETTRCAVQQTLVKLHADPCSTRSTLMTWLLYALAQNPDVDAKASFAINCGA